MTRARGSGEPARSGAGDQRSNTRLIAVGERIAANAEVPAALREKAAIAASNLRKIQAWKAKRFIKTGAWEAPDET